MTEDAASRESQPLKDGPMRVWVDVTNSPHVVIFRPLIKLLREKGHEVTVTSRDFAQTLGLLEKWQMEHQVFGAHGGGSLLAKGRAAMSRTTQLIRFARRKRFDLAIAHGSTDQPIAARLAGTPQVTMFDYEFATVMHHLNGRFATRIVTPDAIPPAALAKYGMAKKLVQYPGLKEEYYLSDYEFDDSVAEELGLDRSKVIAVMRPPPEVTLYHRGRPTEVFDATLRHLSNPELDVQTVVLPRTDYQRKQLVGQNVIVPERPVDGPSLVRLADMVISAGGTMNREAAALGVPAWTTFAGRIGAVDKALAADERLVELADPLALPLGKRSAAAATRRDLDALWRLTSAGV